MSTGSPSKSISLEALLISPLSAHPIQLHDSCPVSDDENPMHHHTHDDVMDCDLKDQPEPMDVTFASTHLLSESTSPMLWKITSAKLPAPSTQAGDSLEF
jgi:hypothetical protein